MTRAQMNWKIIRSIIPIIGLWIIVNSTQNLKKDYKPTEPILKIKASDLVWRFQVNEGSHLIGKTIQISGVITYLDSIQTILDKKVLFLNDSTQNNSFKINDTIFINARCANFQKKTGLCEVDHVTIISN